MRENKSLSYNNLSANNTTTTVQQKKNTEEQENTVSNKKEESAKSNNDKDLNLSKGFAQMLMEADFTKDNDARKPHFPDNVYLTTQKPVGDPDNKILPMSSKFPTPGNGQSLTIGDIGKKSGVTIGFGLDIGARYGSSEKDKAKNDFINAGVAADTAETLSAVVGITGLEAAKKCNELRQKNISITGKNTFSLLKLTLPDYEKKRYSKKDESSYGYNNGDGKIHPALEEFITYAGYWGKASLWRELVEAGQSSENHKEQFAEAIKRMDAIVAKNVFINKKNEEDLKWVGKVCKKIKHALATIKEVLDSGGEIKITDTVQSLEELKNENKGDTFEFIKDVKERDTDFKGKSKNLGRQLDGLDRKGLIQEPVGTGAPNLPKDVRIVQGLLYNAGYAVETSGDFDNDTYNALQDFMVDELGYTRDKYKKISPGKGVCLRLKKYKYRHKATNDTPNITAEKTTTASIETEEQNINEANSTKELNKATEQKEKQTNSSAKAIIKKGIISSTVGKGADNQEKDVHVVQALLVKNGFSLDINGKYDDSLYKALQDYMVIRMGYKRDKYPFIAPHKSVIRHLKQNQGKRFTEKKEKANKSTYIVKSDPQSVKEWRNQYEDENITCKVNDMTAYIFNHPEFIKEVFNQEGYFTTDNLAFKLTKALDSMGKISSLSADMKDFLHSQMDDWSTSKEEDAMMKKLKGNSQNDDDIKKVEASTNLEKVDLNVPNSKPSTDDKDTEEKTVTKTTTIKEIYKISGLVGFGKANAKEDVIQVQKALRGLGYDVKANGIIKSKIAKKAIYSDTTVFNSYKTIGALFHFQAQYSLGADGVAGKGTIKKINEVISIVGNDFKKNYNKRKSKEINSKNIITTAKINNSYLLCKDNKGYYIPKELLKYTRELIKNLEIISDECKKIDGVSGNPSITCGYRSPEHNFSKAVGSKAKLSKHQLGMAADIKPPTGMDIKAFRKLMQKLFDENKIKKGYKKDNYNTFIHYDVRN